MKTEELLLQPNVSPGHDRSQGAGIAPRSTLSVLVQLVDDNRQWLLKATIVGLLVSIAIAFLIPTRYEATARLMPPDETSGFSGMAAAALMSKVGGGIGSLAGDLLGLHTTGATLVGILNSRTVQDDIINQLDLRKVYWKKRYEDARKKLQDRTSISEDKKSGIITISVQDGSPQRAVQIASLYVDELNDRVAQLSTSSARREREFLEQRLAEVKKDLDASSVELSQFSSTNKTFDPQVQGKAMLEAASTLQGQLIAAEAELSGLRQIYGPENARVRAASARVSQLNEKMRRFAGTQAQSGDAGSTSGEPYPSLRELPILGRTYAELYRNAKINETIYEVLMQQYEMAKVQEAKDTPSVKVLDRPVLPERKVWPPRTVIILLGTITFFLLALLYLMLRNAYHELSPDDERRLLGDSLLHVLSGQKRNPVRALTSEQD